MANDLNKKWDIKQLGIGGGSVLAALFLFQEKGLDLITQNQQVRDQVIIERTKANSDRIEKLEISMQNLEQKLDNGFQNVRNQIRQEIMQLSELIRLASDDRYTKQEHAFYAETVNEKIKDIRQKIKNLESKISK